MVRIGKPLHNIGGNVIIIWNYSIYLAIFIYLFIAKITIDISQKNKNRATIGFSNPIPRYISTGNEINMSKRCLYLHVHYSQ
jgi:hypothetical protein